MVKRKLQKSINTYILRRRSTQQNAGDMALSWFQTAASYSFRYQDAAVAGAMAMPQLNTGS